MVETGVSGPGSLRGLRVLDLTSNVAGPFAAQILGDLGADVIKIERPGGDDCRTWGPPFWDESHESVLFTGLNRNKRSIELDLKREDDTVVLDQLIGSADVLLQSFRPGAFASLGYGVDRCHALNPELIYCDISGFGSTGPMAMRPAYDPLIQAFSGIMDQTGEADSDPLRVPVSLLDQGTGMWAVIGILDALRTRDRERGGTHLELSLIETSAAWQPAQILGFRAAGTKPKRRGSAAPFSAPYQAFATRDGFVIVAAGNQRLWERLCQVLEAPQLAADPRFTTNADRVTNLEALAAALTAIFRTKPTSQWVELLEAVGVPVAPINDVEGFIESDQFRATGMLQATPEGPSAHLVLTTPIRVRGRRYAVRRPAPLLNEHGAEVRRELPTPAEPPRNS